MIESPVAILARIVDEGDMSAAEARRFLSWRFSTRDQARVAELSERASSGTITESEGVELDAFIDAGDMLATLHARARRALREQGENIGAA